MFPVEPILPRILTLRDERVMLDQDLAGLYGVETRTLLQALRRNIGRFPKDFAFQLDGEEWALLRSQSVIPNSVRGGRRYAPFAFTEQGVAMLSSVLTSERAIQVNITIMRAFTQLRRMAATHADLTRKLESLEKRYDQQFRVVFDAIRQLMEPPAQPGKPPIGFKPPKE